MQWSDKRAEDYFLRDGALGIRVSRKRWSDRKTSGEGRRPTATKLRKPIQLLRVS